MGSVVKGITGGGGKDSAKAATQASQQASAGQIAASQVAADAAIQGANTAATYQRLGSETAGNAQFQALQQLREADRLPSGLREAALKNLGANYGLTYGPDGSIVSDGSSILDRAQASPFYQNAVKVGENSVLRNASATGGLRSGNASENLAQVNQNALLSSYQDQLSGLSGLSSLPSNANNIAAATAAVGNTYGQGQAAYGSTIGQGQVNAGNAIFNGQLSSANTLAQGQIAAANAGAQGGQNQFNNLLGLGGLAMQGFSMFSDRRLKQDIKEIGVQNGHRIYSWRWNEEAEKLGKKGESFGVIADEIENTHPSAVSIQDGYKVVDYAALGVNHGL